MNFDPIQLTQEFVAQPSVTEESNQSASDVMCNRLSELGFQVEQQEYTDQQGVLKILSCGVRRAVRSAPGARPLGYFCHNDVVSVAGWDCSHGGPFEGVLAEDKLWGRGSCDMKGSAATAMAAISRISAKEQTAPIFFFITGDEECGMEGAKLVGQSALFQELSAGQGVGIVGEPTELQVVNSHKGGYHFEVAANGVAAHSSTVDGLNANWTLIPFLSYLSQVQQRCLQDPELQNSEFDPPHLSLNPVVINRPVATNITVGTSNLPNLSTTDACHGMGGIGGRNIGDCARDAVGAEARARHAPSSHGCGTTLCAGHHGKDGTGGTTACLLRDGWLLL